MSLDTRIDILRGWVQPEAACVGVWRAILVEHEAAGARRRELKRLRTDRMLSLGPIISGRTYAAEPTVRPRTQPQLFNFLAAEVLR